jgi:hypothetical protein
MSAPLRIAQPGEPTCCNVNCLRRNALAAGGNCAACGQPTRPVPHGQQTAGAQRIGGTGAALGDIIGRVIFGGFWTLVTIGLIIAGFGSLGNGHPGGLLALGGAVLTGLYAIYLFRGGRFRILFW